MQPPTTTVFEAGARTPVPGALEMRPSRPPDYGAENRALQELAATLAESPGDLLQRLAEAALRVCQADSSGVSFVEPGPQGPQFRWRALCGAWRGHVGKVAAGSASPCGVVFEQRRAILFRAADLPFPCLRELQPAPLEALVVPFFVDRKIAGTVWIVAHSLARRFDSEDLRTLTALAQFAAAAHRMMERTLLTDGMRAERSAALNLMEDAVTARRETERVTAALRTSEQHLRTLANGLDQLIWTNDAAGRADYFNQRWHDYSGQTLDESLEAGWHGIVHPEDQHAAVTCWRAALKHGTTFDIECRLRRADGAYRWFIGRSLPLRDASGKVTGWFGSATDIHELKAAQALAHEREEQFRHAIEDAPIPVIMYAADGEVLQVSRTWSELTGYSVEEVANLSTWHERSHDPAADSLLDRMLSIFTIAERRLRFEARVRTASGETRDWVFTISAPGLLQDSRPFAVGMALDVTERARAEEALRESEARLRNTDARKNQFLAMLGHELRNPLAAIRGGMSLLLSEKSRPETRQETLPVVAQQVAHMERLVDDVLDVTRVVEGRLQVRRQPMLVQQAVLDAIAMIRRSLDAGGFELRSHLEKEPLAVDGDAVRLTQIFVNLLHNAVKYSAGSRVIEIFLERDDRHARFRIRDFGQGIEAEILPRIFDPFVQAVQASTLEGGLGLGLTVVQQLVLVHGGSVGVRSAGPGQGAEFTVRLPLLEAAP